MGEMIRRYQLVHRPGKTYPDLVPCKKGDYWAMCYSKDVALIESECAELKKKCAELETKGAELLKALERLLGGWQSDTDTLNKAVEFAHTAIAKAKGNFVEYYPQCGEIPNEADCNLVAAAPDLLEAAANALWWWDGGNKISPKASGVFDKLRAAIAKAKGEIL